jgi:O-antigen ligase
MRVKLFPEPFNRDRLRTFWVVGTVGVLFLLAAAATLTISLPERMANWGYECGVFLLAAVWMLLRTLEPRPLRVTWAATALAAIAIWGFLQLVLGATLNPHATMEVSLRLAALAATALVASSALANARLRLSFLQGLAWFGFLVAIVGVLAYYTSPGKILWIFPSEYPDVWGPFLSRNNFAGFLELTLPVALWLAFEGDRPRRLVYTVMAAAMLAAGLASASRAGATVLVLQTGVALMLLRRAPSRTPMVMQLAAATAVLAAVAGAGTLAARLGEPDPMQYRREIARSALEMIREHPWKGFGLGTFASVYPAYATFDAGARVNHAHNDWLEWASQGGLPFAAAWAVLALATLKPALGSVWGLGIPAAFIHALVDDPFARFGLTAWIFALSGALLGRLTLRGLRESGY